MTGLHAIAARPRPRVKRALPDPLNKLVRLCPNCGSGDVRWCGISVRPYCAECNTWGATNFGTAEDAVEAWNAKLKRVELESIRADALQVIERLALDTSLNKNDRLSAIIHVVREARKGK